MNKLGALEDVQEAKYLGNFPPSLNSFLQTIMEPCKPISLFQLFHFLLYLFNWYSATSIKNVESN